MEKYNISSCLFKMRKIFESGEVIKFKKSQGAIIEADSPANFHDSPNTNINIVFANK
jgi:hypothetical protein